jgi:hypothetical protein
MEYPIYFSAKTTFVGRQRLTCQRRSSSSGEQSRGTGQSKLSQLFSKRQKESIKDPSVELSHGSGTCLPQESKGSGDTFQARTD